MNSFRIQGQTIVTLFGNRVCDIIINDDGTYVIQDPLTPDEHKEIADAVARHLATKGTESWLTKFFQDHPVIKSVDAVRALRDAHNLEFREAHEIVKAYLDTHTYIRCMVTPGDRYLVNEIK